MKTCLWDADADFLSFLESLKAPVVKQDINNSEREPRPNPPKTSSIPLLTLTFLYGNATLQPLPNNPDRPLCWTTCVKPVKPRRHPTSDLPLPTIVPVGKIRANLERIGKRTIPRSLLKAKKLVLPNQAEVVVGVEERRRTPSRMGAGNEIPRNHNHILRGWLRTGIPSRSKSTPLDNPDHHQLQDQDRGKSRSYNVPFLLFPIRSPLVHDPLPRQVLPTRQEVPNRTRTLVRNPLLLPVKANRARLPTKEVGGRTTRIPRRLDNNALNGVLNPYYLPPSMLVLVNNKVRRGLAGQTTTGTITARSRLLVPKAKERAKWRELDRRARTGLMPVSRNGRGREVDRGRRREKRVGLRQRGRGSVEMEVEHPLERLGLTISRPCVVYGCCVVATTLLYGT